MIKRTFGCLFCHQVLIVCCQGPRLFFLVVVVGASFFFCRGLFGSLIVPVRTLLRSQLSDALLVLASPLWCARSGSVRNLCSPCLTQRSTCILYKGSWSCANWAFDRKVRTLCAFLDSDSGAASWCLGEDTAES